MHFHFPIIRSAFHLYLRRNGILTQQKIFTTFEHLVVLDFALNVCEILVFQETTNKFISIFLSK